MRIKTRKEQLTLEGCYTGGTVPYGYQLIRKGRLNKKGNEMRDLAIEPVEAEIVREIFNKTIHEGYGSYRIADMLNKRGLRTHSGSKFQCNTIIRILRNRLYCGYIVSGNVTSEALSELTIVESDIFDQAQYILDQRAEGKGHTETANCFHNQGTGTIVRQCVLRPLRRKANNNPL